MGRLLCALVLAACAGCSQGGRKASTKQRDDGGGDPHVAQRCSGLAAHVRALYVAEQEPASADPDIKALVEDVLSANVDMVLTDCRDDVGRVAPCIERARRVADLERECLIPLDDDGQVEGRKFSR
jgi:hypothetical protein